GEAARVLVKSGPEAAPAVPALIKALGLPEGEDDPATVRKDLALQVLEAIGPAALPELREAFQDRDRPLKVRTGCIKLLGRLGSGGREAVPALLEALSDPDRSIRRHAASALYSLKPDPEAA